MKKTLFVMFIFSSVFGFSQKKFTFKEHHYPAKYVLKNSSDTIQTHIVNLGAFKAATYSPATFINKMAMIDDNGKRTVIKEKDVSYLEFIDNKNVKRHFIDTKNLSAEEVYLVEPLYEGKMSYYVDYYFVNIYGNTGSREYLTENNKETITSGLFSGSSKKLKERFVKYPDLLALVEEMKTKEDLIKILELYNQK